MVAAQGIKVIVYRHHVDTLAGLQGDVPVVLGHAGDDMVVGELPVGAHVAILNPDVGILGSERDFGDRVLHEDAGVRLAVVVHDLALVAHDVLQAQGRRNHVARRTEMIELASRQRQDGYRELTQLGVVKLRVGAQTTSEVTVEVVVDGGLVEGGGWKVKPASFHQQLDGTVAEQPHADVGEEEMVALQVVQLGNGGLLKHLLQHAGGVAVHQEHTVMGGYGGIEPQTVANDVGLGY